MRALITLFLACLPALSFAEAQAIAQPLPRILILTTGGTIASRSDAPMVDGPALVQAVPQLLDHARIEVEEFSVIGSSKMTPAHWLALARRINALLANDADLGGIVVTHGTDTLEETAYFLNLTVKSEKPVVMTGSMRSSDEVSADGPANLINAVRVAASEAAVGHGVLVALNETILGARDTWKTDNRRADTFQGAGGGQLGAVDPDGVRFYRRDLQPHTTESEFDVSDLETLPRVLILSDFTGIDREVVEHFLRQEMDGLVIRSFAGGRISAGMLAGLKSQDGAAPPTVVASRVPRGRIVSAPAYPFPAIAAQDQQDNKARILLMLALTRSSDPDEIQRVFDTY
jgi:L-asparaginase type II